MSQTSTVRLLFLGDASQAVRQISTLEGRFGSLRRGLTLAAAAAGTTFVGGVALAIKKAADFEKVLNVLQATSGATDRQMRSLRARARELGADLTLPATSAKDAADAMLELSKGGLTVTQTLKAARGVLELSTAAQIENAEAAKIVARSLGAFSLSGEEASRVADVLANAAVASTGEITDFAMGLQQSSAVANAYGLTIEQTVGALARFADAGIVGSDAGTMFKRVLQTLEPTTEKAAGLMDTLGLKTVNLKDGTLDFNATISLFHRQLQKLDPVQRRQIINQLAGSDAARGWNILFGKSGEVADAYTQKMSRVGTAQKIAEAQTKGFHGAVEGLKSVLETVAIDVGTMLLPVATDVARELGKIVARIGEIIALPTMKLRLTLAMDDVRGIGEWLFGGQGIRQTVDADLLVKPRNVRTEGLVDKLGQAITEAAERVNWDTIGGRIGRGIASGIHFTADQLDRWLGELAGWVDRNQARIGQIGATIAASIAGTLIDPGFWAQHMDLAVALILTRFGGGLAKGAVAIAGRFGRALAAPLAAGGALAGEALLGGLLRVGARLPARVQGLFISGLALAERAIQSFAANWDAWIGRLLSSIGRLISEGFQRLPGVIRAAFAIFAVGTMIAWLHKLVEKIQAVIHWFGEAAASVERLASKIKGLPLGPLEVLAGIGGGIGGAVGRAKQAVGDWGAGAPGGGNIVAVGRWLQGLGFQVGEHPAFGGVGSGHVKGSYHYKGRAIDVNADGFPGGEMAALDRIYPILAAMNPTELLWRVKGHFNHLHLAFARGGIVPVPRGQPVGATVHGGEMILTEQQQAMLGGQALLARLLGFTGGEGPSFAAGGIVGVGVLPEPPRRRRPGKRNKIGLRTRFSRKVTGERAVDDAITAIDAMDENLYRTEQTYDLRVDTMGLNDSEFLVTDEDGNELVDVAAVNREVAELDELIGMRRAIIEQRQALRSALNHLIGLIRSAIEQLKTAIAAAVAAGKEEQRTVNRLRGQLGGLRRQLRRAEAKKKKTAGDNREIARLKTAITENETATAQHEKKRDNAYAIAGEFQDRRKALVEAVPGYDRESFDTGIQIGRDENEIVRMGREKGEIAGTRARPPAGPGEGGGGGGDGFWGDFGAAFDDSALKEEIERLREQIGRLRLALGVEAVQIPIIGQFQRGSLHVPETGMALVHAGERITPAGVPAGGDGGSIGDILVKVVVEDGAVNADRIRAEAVRAAPAIGAAIGQVADERRRSGRY